MQAIRVFTVGKLESSLARMGKAFGTADKQIDDETLTRDESSVIGQTSFTDGELISQYSGIEPRASINYKLGAGTRYSENIIAFQGSFAKT